MTRGDRNVCTYAGIVVVSVRAVHQVTAEMKLRPGGGVTRLGRQERAALSAYARDHLNQAAAIFRRILGLRHLIIEASCMPHRIYVIALCGAKNRLM